MPTPPTTSLVTDQAHLTAPGSGNPHHRSVPGRRAAPGGGLRPFLRCRVGGPAGSSGALLLAAARKIALAHGGALEIAPLEGGGCRLVLGVPAAD